MILEEGQTPPTRSSSASRQPPPPSNASTFSLSPFPPRPGTSSSSTAAYARGAYGPLSSSSDMYERARASSPLEGYSYSGQSSFEQFPRLERGGGLGGMGAWFGGRNLKYKLVLTVALGSLVFLLHDHFFRRKHHGPPPWLRGPNMWQPLDRMPVEQAAQAAAAAGLPPPPAPGRQPPPPSNFDEDDGPPPPGKPKWKPTFVNKRPPGADEAGGTWDEVEAERIAQDEAVPLASIEDYIAPRRETPSSSAPWSHLPRDWFGHELLSTKRFPVGREASAMRDPPALAPPPASYLTKAYEWAKRASGNRIQLGHSGSAPKAFDSEGRPIQLPREDLVLGGRGWTAPKLKVSELGTPRDRTSVSSWPKVQADGSTTGGQRESEEKERREWVKRAFAHCWEGYKKFAWGHDELKPVSEGFKDPYNGWGATIVDSLDTLLILGFEHEYNIAREHVRQLDFTFLSPAEPRAFSTDLPPLEEMDGLPQREPDSGPQSDDEDEGPRGGSPAWPDKRSPKDDVNFRSPSTIPTFETVIRYLGGLISAYDLAQDPLMLQRAIELADWILPALGTEFGLLSGGGRYVLGADLGGKPSGQIALAETGSLTLELTRLSMITGDEDYFKAAQRITDTLDTRFDPAKPMDGTTKSRRGRLGTLLPHFVDPDITEVTGEFSFGAMSDSYYEYLIKQAHLLSGSMEQYSRMYTDAIDSAYEHLIKPIETVPGRDDLTVLGSMRWGSFVNELQHLTCFAGGMMGLGAKLLNRPHDLATGINITEACTFAYESTATGIGPESVKFFAKDDRNRYRTVPTADGRGRERIPVGTPAGVRSSNAHHIGRPETIESVFYMYRLTGDRKWQDKGWQMFTSWVEHALTPAGLTDVHDVHLIPSAQEDGMQSFVLAETLKYYFLLFSDFDTISLDTYVLNTEAHPFRRPVKQQSIFAQGGRTPEPGPFWSGPNTEFEPAPSFVGKKADGNPVQKWFRVQQAHALANIPNSPPPSSGRRPARVGQGFVKPTFEQLQQAQKDREEKIRLLNEKMKDEIDDRNQRAKEAARVVQ